MPLVDSLLTAIVRSDGDALVLHVGEKPYVVAATGAVELSRQGLGLGAMEGLLAQLLSAEALRGLREMGAVEHELAGTAAAAGDRFTVVAARGGDDIWIEIRRHRRVRELAILELPVEIPAPAVETPAPALHGELPPVTEIPHVEATPAVAAAQVEAAAPPVHVEPAVVAPVVPVEAPPAVTKTEPTPVLEETPQVAIPAAAAAPAPTPSVEPAPVEDPYSAAALAAAIVGEPIPLPTFAPFANGGLEADADATAREPMPEMPLHVEGMVEAPPAEAHAEPVPAAASAPPPIEARPVMPAPTPEPVAARASEWVPVSPPVPPPAPVPLPVAPPQVAAAPEMQPARRVEPPVPVRPQPRVEAPAPTPEPTYATNSDPTAYAPTLESSSAFVPEPQPTLPGLAAGPYAVDGPLDGGRTDAAPDALPGVVLSLTRDNARSGGASGRGSVRPGGIERLLRLASARGASALYLTTQARPAVRVDGDIRLLESEPALSSGDVEAAVLELAPEGARDKESAEWIRDLQDIGRVRITTFRDYRGPGALLRMISARATSAEQLGLVREIQALATEPEGLVIVTGPRASGKSTLVSAFVDLINRQRNDYVVTLEGQIRLVHESRGSLISQREVRGSAADVVSAARAALRENPDVMVIEDLRSPDVLQVALDAAGSGLLVFASVTAASATAALERLVDLCPSEQRRTVRAALAEHLRGVVAQVLLRKAGGGRLAARELVLNTNAVAALVSDGQIAQLPRAIDSGRKLGMAPLNDALVAFVQSGAVDVREAYRKADDKVGLLALLRREGIDTSFVERLA